MITMKKKLFTLLMAIIAMASLHAQEGTIVYTEYNCDTLISGNFVSICFDVDSDGQSDLRIIRIDGSTTEHVCGFQFVEEWWNYSDTTLLATFWGQEQGLGHDTLLMGDTIANCVRWEEAIDILYENPNVPMPLNGVRFYIGTRKKVGNSFIYGWLDLQPFWSNGLYIRLYGTAFCTIPDYPLMAGQTSLDWGLEDTEATAFATIHPNPTTGLVTITGKALKQAEVLNTLGQCVATAQGKGEMLQIDIANLPTGIYFVRVTDEEGRKCVRKVVKE